MSVTINATYTCDLCGSSEPQRASVIPPTPEGWISVLRAPSEPVHHVCKICASATVVLATEAPFPSRAEMTKRPALRSVLSKLGLLK